VAGFQTLCLRFLGCTSTASETRGLESGSHSRKQLKFLRMLDSKFMCSTPCQLQQRFQSQWITTITFRWETRRIRLFLDIPSTPFFGLTNKAVAYGCVWMPAKTVEFCGGWSPQRPRANANNRQTGWGPNQGVWLDDACAATLLRLHHGLFEIWRFLRQSQVAG